MSKVYYNPLHKTLVENGRMEMIPLYYEEVVLKMRARDQLNLKLVDWIVWKCLKDLPHIYIHSEKEMQLAKEEPFQSLNKIDAQIASQLLLSPKIMILWLKRNPTCIFKSWQALMEGFLSHCNLIQLTENRLIVYVGTDPGEIWITGGGEEREDIPVPTWYWEIIDHWYACCPVEATEAVKWLQIMEDCLDREAEKLKNAPLKLSDQAIEQIRKSGPNFTGANLQRATFRGANLPGANFTRADLTGADLTDAHFDYATFEGAKVSQEQLERAASLTGTIMPDGFVHK